MNNNQEPVTQTDVKTEVTVTDTDKKTGRTFTQDEVNAMILKETNKINKKYEGVDLEKYKNWVESQKTETEKQTELTKNLANATNENQILKQENQVLKSGVNADDVDYVLFKVSKMEGEFEDNLKDFLKNNPKYLKKIDTTNMETKDSGIGVSKINENAESGVSAILKQKHPELFK